MFRLAMVVLPDPFLASVGAMTDSCSLVYDRFRHLVAEAGKKVPDMSLSVLSIDGRPVEMGGGMTCRVDGAIERDDRFDFIWLPSFRVGGLDALRRRLASSQRLVRWLQGQAEAGTLIGASGSAVTLLVAARLLEGMRVPVSRVFQPTFRALYPRCLADDKLSWIKHGNLLLSRGIAMDFPVIAQAIGQAISPSSGRWLAEVSAVSDGASAHLSADPLVASAQLWIEQLYATDMTMADLAERLSTSQPTLARRFKRALGITPKTYAQAMRMRAAKAMLADTNLSIEQIARFVGYGDVRVFRRAFRKFTGDTAGTWRRSPPRDDRKAPHIED